MGFIYSFTLSTTVAPVNTSRNNFSASSANRTMFVCLSEISVSASLVTSPSRVDTAKKTYPLHRHKAVRVRYVNKICTIRISVRTVFCS